jgi:hypothetical protein
VWPPTLAPIDLDATWPTPIVRTIVDSFTKPGAQVVLLPWPTPQTAHSERHRLGVVGPDTVIHHVPGTDPDDEVGDALAAVESLDRSPRVVHVAAQETLTAPASRPLWTDIVGAPHRAPVTGPAPSPQGLDDPVLDRGDAVAPKADLIVTSLRPETSRDHASDHVALVAARLLRTGGILAVLTHCDWPVGELIDPTGAVVASAQNADLLYLQHIVALHAPVRDGHVATELLAEADDSASERQTRAAHRATVRGLPAPHQRIHSDVLVFAQPRAYAPPATSPAEQAKTTGIIR